MIDEEKHNACLAQGFLFKQAYKENYDMPEFINTYLSSDFVKRQVDDWRGRYHQELFLKVILGLLPELKSCRKNDGDKTSKMMSYFNEDVAYNTGYIYRLLCELTGKNSDEIYKIIPLSDIMYYISMLEEYPYESVARTILEKYNM